MLLKVWSRESYWSGKCLLQFAHERSTEIETLETFIAMWQNNFIVVEYNRKKLELVYLFKVNFPSNSFLLYFTQIVVHYR